MTSSKLSDDLRIWFAKKDFFMTRGEWLIVAAITLIGAMVCFYVVLQARKSILQTRIKWDLAAISMGVSGYQEIYHCFPSRVYRDQHGNPATSWRFAISNMMDANSGYNPQLNTPWNAGLNAHQSQFPNPWFCGPDLDNTRHTNTRIYMIDCDDNLFGRSNLDEKTIPNNVVVAVCTEILPPLNWTAPGDICLDTTRTACHATLENLPEKFDAWFRFWDGQTWHTQDRNAFLTLARFTNITYARTHQREPVQSKSCHPLKQD